MAASLPILLPTADSEMDFSKTPIVEVNTENFGQVWPLLQRNMLECTFMAVDAEMSGLGSEINNFQSNANDRYKTLKNAAQTRSLISIGITCFKLLEEERVQDDCQPSDSEHKAESIARIPYEAKPYNILLLCTDSFTIDPNAVSFLVKHGFDFNLQFSKGLKYKKGDYVKPKKNDTHDPAPSSRQIFEEMVRVRKPLIFHNGFADLVFLYQCFYASCPDKLSVFLSDLNEMFPGGIYDTKVAAHFHDKLNSTFLEYVTKTYQATNIKLANANRSHVKLSFCDGTGTIDHLVGPPIGIFGKCDPTPELKVCPRYAKSGWCGLYDTGKCNLSHKVLDILEHEEREKLKKRKRKKQPCLEAPTGEFEQNDRTSTILTKRPKNHASNGSSKAQSGPLCHRAGVDSLLTGFSFAVFTASHTKKSDLIAQNFGEAGKFSMGIPYLPQTIKNELVNRLYLNGKNPLWVTKSHFSKTSTAHDDNIIRIFVE